MSNGPAKLKAYLGRSGISQAALAKKAGVSEALVSMLLLGRRNAGISAAAIEKATKGAVPATSWLRSSRRAA